MANTRPTADQIIYKSQRTTRGKLEESVSVLDFMTPVQIADVQSGNPTLDMSVPLLAARNYASTHGVALTFPAGEYAYSQSPNWAYDHAKIYAHGKVILRYTGTGTGILIDAGHPGKVSNVDFGGQGEFIIKCAGTSPVGLYARNIYRSKINARCWGAGTNAAAIRYEGCVLVESRLTVTVDEGGWYLGSKPLLGISLGQSALGAQTAYCTFINPNVQGCQIGFYVDATLGNVFIGGDSEYNDIYGISLNATALNNKFIGTDFEVNGVQDIVCYGSYNEFHGVDTNTDAVFQSGSVANQLIGGNHDNVTIASGATNTLIANVKYARGLGAATMSDAGTGTRFRDNFNCATGKYHNAPPTSGVISVTATPFVYTNTSNRDLDLFIQGGVISNMTYWRGSDPLGVFNTNSVVRVQAGDALVISYTSAPTIKFAST